MGRLLAGTLAILALTVSGCAVLSDPWGDAGDKVKVIVTIPPLESFVRAVGGKYVEVICLCTQNGPHHFKADTSELAAFRTANLFLGVGLTLDDTFSRKLNALARRGDLRFTRLGTKLPKELLLKTTHTHHHHEEGDAGHHHHGNWDPHIWLGIPQAIHMVETIRDELIAVDKDEDHQKAYEANAKKYVKKLKDLQKKGKELLADVTSKRLITFHESFGYLAKDFGLEVAAVMEVGPGDEPTAAELGQIIELVKESKKKGKPIGCITVEPQYASGSVKRVQDSLKGKGVKIKVIKVNPMETADPEELKKEGGEWYLNRMLGKTKKGILQQLADALK